VRFNEEVKVKNIKAGKKRKLPSTEDLLQPYDDDSTTSRPVLDGSVDGPDELTLDDSSLGDDSVINGQEAIVRLKDDLFADRDENENGRNVLRFIVMVIKGRFPTFRAFINTSKTNGSPNPGNNSFGSRKRRSERLGIDGGSKLPLKTAKLALGRGPGIRSCHEGGACDHRGKRPSP
jgi:hypothetical protein